MHRKVSAALAGIFMLLGHSMAEGLPPREEMSKEDIQKGFWELSAKDPNGKVYKMEDYDGTVVVIVTAPRQCDGGVFYQTLEHMHSIHPYALEIVAFPFTNKDFNTDECLLNILAKEVKGSQTIRIMERADINGPDTHPIFKYLKDMFDIDQLEEQYPSYFFVDPEGIPVEVHYGASYNTLKKFIDQYAEMDWVDKMGCQLVFTFMAMQTLREAIIMSMGRKKM